MKKISSLLALSVLVVLLGACSKKASTTPASGASVNGESFNAITDTAYYDAQLNTLSLTLASSNVAITFNVPGFTGIPGTYTKFDSATSGLINAIGLHTISTGQLYISKVTGSYVQGTFSFTTVDNIIVTNGVFNATLHASDDSISIAWQKIMRAHKWKFINGTVMLRKPSGSDSTFDVAPFMPVCHQDDYLSFDPLGVGAIFAGAAKCNQSDPDSLSFTWSLHDNNLSFNGIYNFAYAVQASIAPPYLDTLSYNPLILDTLSHNPLVLDTIYTVGYGAMPFTSINVNNGTLTSFTGSSFTLKYDIVSASLDTSVTHRWAPANRVDTFHFSVKYDTL